MNLEEARRSGLPIAVGGSTDIEDQRPDLIGPGVEIPVSMPAATDAEEVVIVHGEPPDLELPEALPQPDAASQPSLDAEVDYVLQRVADIEAKLRAKLRLHEIHAALDRVDALLK
jgi:hypothetical protein